MLCVCLKQQEILYTHTVTSPVASVCLECLSDDRVYLTAPTRTRHAQRHAPCSQCASSWLSCHEGFAHIHHEGFAHTHTATSFEPSTLIVQKKVCVSIWTDGLSLLDYRLATTSAQNNSRHGTSRHTHTATSLARSILIVSECVC